MLFLCSCVLIGVGQYELDQHVVALLNVVFYAKLKSRYKCRGLVTTLKLVQKNDAIISSGG